MITINRKQKQLLAHELYHLWHPGSVCDMAAAGGDILNGIYQCNRGTHICGFDSEASFFRRYLAYKLPAVVRNAIICAHAYEIIKLNNAQYDVVVCIDYVDTIDKRHTVPLCDNIRSICKQYALITTVEPQHWIDHMETNGWIYDEEQTCNIRSMWRKVSMKYARYAVVFAKGSYAD